MGLMKEKVGEPELLCRCAEECAEMAQAALKPARILRGINPTPISEEEARQNLKEEFSGIDLSQTTDLTSCCAVIERGGELYVASQFYLPAGRSRSDPEQAGAIS